MQAHVLSTYFILSVKCKSSTKNKEKSIVNVCYRSKKKNNKIKNLSCVVVDYKVREKNGEI